MQEYIIGAICVIAVAVLCYFLYRKVANQQEEIEKLIHRQRSLEAFLFKPPPRQEIVSLFEKETRSCESCDLNPVKLETRVEPKTESAQKSQPIVEESQT